MFINLYLLLLFSQEMTISKIKELTCVLSKSYSYLDQTKLGKLSFFHYIRSNLPEKDLST